MKKSRLLKIKIGNKEFSLSFIFSVLSSAIGAVFSFLCARFLEADLYGEIHYYISIASLLSTFLVFGVDNYVVKNGQFEEDKQSLISNSYIFTLLLSTLILPLYFRVAVSFLNRLNGNVGLIMFLFLVALSLSFSTIFFAYLQSINKYQIKLFVSSLIPHVLFLLAFAVHYLTNTLSLFVDLYLVYYLAIYGLIGLVLFFRYLFPIKKFFDASAVKTILYFGLTYALYNCTSPIASILIGEKYESFGVVGIFSLSNQLLTIASLATGIITQTSLSTFSKLAKNEQGDKMFANFERITRINIYISVPFYAAFIFEAEPLMGFFGDSYMGHSWIVILLSVSSLIECVTGPCGSVLLMGGKEKENLVASIVKIVFYLGILAGLINFTELAAPIAGIVSAFFSNALKLFFLSKYQKRLYFTWKILLTFFAVFGISSIAFFLLSLIANQAVWLIANLVIGLGLIICFVLLTPFKKDKEFFVKGKEV